MLKNFRANIIIRAILLLVLSVLLAWVLVTKSWFFTPLVISMVILGIIINLIYYVEKTTRNLTLFLLNIKQSGFSSSFKKINADSTGLYHVFDDILKEFQRITIEKESHYQYLQAVNENIGVGLISFSGSDIELMNPYAQRLLHITSISKLVELEAEHPKVYDVIKKMQSGERSIIKVVIANELIDLALTCKKIKLQERPITLIILQNINAELELKELEAWQKLISVLTHEIMNSVTPIASLSEALNKELKETPLEELDSDDLSDFTTSLQTIENRSKGLMRFVNAYKEFTRSPVVNITNINMLELVSRVTGLLDKDLEIETIKCLIDVPQSHKIHGDVELIEQVLINLIKNALDVLKGEVGEKKIKVTSKMKGNHLHLYIADNGPGIEPEVLQNIFVPFFTTKKKGTGVGLSFARKVMKLHNGQIRVNSETGQGTQFTLIF